MLEPDPVLGVNRDTVLPWVPDLVGIGAQGDRAILVVGAAYAGFIREYSGRGACLPLADYVAASRIEGDEGWAAFQRSFLDHVARPDGDYYGKLADLLTEVGVTADRIVLSDLVPASIVRRCATAGRRQDDSSQLSGKQAQVFHQYTEHPEVRGATWRRITESGAPRVVALGHLAEHGLLRLFARQGATIYYAQRPWSPARRSGDELECLWVDEYADRTKTLGFWLTPGRWWTIKLAGKEIRLLPIYHPARVHKHDQGYTRTAKALAAMLGGQRSAAPDQVVKPPP